MTGAAAGTGESEAPFAGEMRQFRIRLGEIRRIEAKCGGDQAVGIGEVLQRLARANLVLSQLEGTEALAAGLSIRADDVREVILQGLTGAGMKSGLAFKLVSAEIDDRGVWGLIDNVDVALVVLMGSQRSPPKADDDPGEQKAGPASPSTPPSPPISGASTASAAPLDSPPARSTSTPPGSSPPPSKAGTRSTAAAKRPRPRRPTTNTTP